MISKPMEFEKFSPPRLPRNIKSSKGECQLISSLKNKTDTDETLLRQIDEMGINRESSQCQTPAKYCRKSTIAGYQRVFDKYSPSTETTMSPLKACQVNLHDVVLQQPDTYVDISIWVVNMSEQFFYDNTLLLLNGSKRDQNLIKEAIRNNSKGPGLEFFENLVDIALIGKGAFGKVYRCTNPSTQKQYAIKYITSKSRNLVEHCKEILSYMAERNSVIRAMNSPFIVDFYYSFQTQSVGGLFLFFEYCLGDLRSIIDQISYRNFSEISFKLENNESGVIQQLDKDVNILDVSLMYIFEMFCGLDFLVQSNIVHQDIKPDNMMISETLHLKIGDFGLVYRTRTIHRRSNKLLVNHGEIDNVESTNYDLTIEGTYEYQDFEFKLMELEQEENPLLKEVMTNKDVFDTPGIDNKDETLKASFLTDTWAAGVISINLLFRGFDFFNPSFLEPKNLKGVPQSKPSEFLIHLIGRQSYYRKYIYNGLLNAGGECHRELMEFLASIFQPRLTRSSLYTNEKTIYHFSQKRSIKYIDMDKIENLQSFRDRNFNCRNIFLVTVPEKIRKYFKPQNRAVFTNFRNMLRGFARITCGESSIDLKPGLIMNYFH